MDEGSVFSNYLQKGETLSKKQKIKFVWYLSIPAILSQLTSILMQYIDAAMVGSLGANASASIGLVSTSTWLLGGLSSAVAAGFSVQAAHSIGSNNEAQARTILKHGMLFSLLFSSSVMIIGMLAARSLPIWLGASPAIYNDAYSYFFVFVCTIPVQQLNVLFTSMLQCSGEMKLPSILNALMCVFDVIFNMIFIRLYGVLGAALGTALSQVVICYFLFLATCRYSPVLRIKIFKRFAINKNILRQAIQIAFPIAIEHIAVCGAMIVSTKIIAPLGTIAIAANSFAVTAESLCYMPGYGIAAAATTLVGQSIGANQRNLAKNFSDLSILLGVIVMGLTGVVMYFLCPIVFKMLTPDISVQQLATQVLRIELFAEPLYAVSIISSGALRGAKDTFIPSLLNLISIWGVRLTLSVLLVDKLGLHGIWIAMAIELCVRGLLLLYREQRGNWLYKKQS